MAFFLIVAVLAFVPLLETNAKTLEVLIVSLFGANAVQHISAAVVKRKE